MITSEQRDFPFELVRVMNKAHALGLHMTGHKLHEAVRQVGWELAYLIDRAEAAAAAKLKPRKRTRR